MALLRPFASRLVASWFGLSLLFTLLSPEASEPLRFFPRAVYWGLHIGIGLAAGLLVARVVLQLRPHTRDWLVVVLAGIGGIVLFAPTALGLEFLFATGAADADNDALARLARSSLLFAVVVEAIELAPPYLAAWLLINLEPVRSAFGMRAVARPVVADRPEAIELPEKQEPDGADGETVRAGQAAGRAFLDRLPPIIGTALVCVSSDLHYLQVVTRQGQAMILGSLQEVEEAFGEHGLRVHRSHWVHVDAVVSLSKSGKGWFLNLVNGHRVPVSRRKRADIIERLGEDFLVNGRAQAAK